MMSEETFFPYTFDPNVLPEVEDERTILNEKLDGGLVSGGRVSDETRQATQHLRAIYDQRLTNAVSWLHSEGKLSVGKAELDEVLTISNPKQMDLEFVRAVAKISPTAVELGDNVMKRVATRLRPSGMGQEIVLAATTIWQSRAPFVWRTLETINTACGAGINLGAVPARFTQNTWEAVVAVVTALFNRIRRSYGEDTPAPLREKFRAIVRYDAENRDSPNLTRHLLAYMAQIGATSHHTTFAAANEIIDVWCMSALVAQVHPVLEQIAAILSGPDIEHESVRVPKYLDMIHNGTDDNILKMNQQLLRYMRDLGVSDFKTTVPELPHEVIENMSDIERAHHYANDLYQVYKLIVRDTLLFQFRSARDRLPGVVQQRWDELMHTTHLPAIDTFLQELLFIPLTGLVGSDFDTPDEVRSIVTSYPIKMEDCILKNALGDSAYVRFLREAAQDCGDRVQVRTETLLKYIASDAFRNLASMAGPSIANSSAYKGIIDVLNHVAAHVSSMGKNILTVFALLNDPNVKSSFLETDQINAGAVLTFVKMRNDNPDHGNRRFDIHLDSHARAMMVKYEVQPHMIYEHFMARKRAMKNGGFTRVTPRQLKPYKDALERAKSMPMGPEKTRAVKAAEVALKAAENGRFATVAVTARADIASAVRASRAAAAPATVAIVPGNTPVSNPTGVNKAGPVAHMNGQRQEVMADETLPAPEGTGEHVVPRGPQTTYVFGPFTRVYKPHETPVTMAKVGEPEARTIQATVVQRLVRGQNVCIFGYGQSGSGKTSYLIYRKDSDMTGELGVMSYICEHMLQSQRRADGTVVPSPWDRMQCDIREIGVTKPGHSSEQVDVLDGNPATGGNVFYAPKIFVPEKGTWVMRDADYSNLPPLRKLGSDPKADPAMSDAEEQVVVPANYIPKAMLRDLGRFVFFSTENKRFTKATTNNPTSSRSHVFVFLRFLPRAGTNAPSPVLVIGDFAGVENKFACDNSAVLRAFATLKKYPENPASDFAYKPEINAAFERHVRSTLVGTPFERVPYSDVELQESKMRVVGAAKQSFQKLASLIRAEAAKQMTSVAFPQTLMGTYISEIVAMKREVGTLPITGMHSSTTDQENAHDRFINLSTARASIYHAAFGGVATLNPRPVKVIQAMKSGAICTQIRSLGAVQSGVSLLDVMLYEIIKVSAQLFMGAECDDRVQEGIYINNSLEIFRNFLSSSLQSKGAVPKILNECGAIQCNPLFNDCFGSTFVSSHQQMGAVEETLVKMLAPKTALSVDPSQRYLDAQKALASLTYCVFNVINISKDRNDPPPTPFIDASPVVYEYNRAGSAATRAELPSKGVSGTPFTQAVGANRFDINVLHELAERTRRIAQDARDAFAANRKQMNLGQAVTAANDVERDALNVINEAIKAENTVKFMSKVREVIDTFERINAATFIGTLIFTDTVAKFGVNRMMCVMPTADSGAYLDASVFGNVKRLNDSMNKIMCDGLLRGNGCGVR
jgi:hypothetical protein